MLVDNDNIMILFVKVGCIALIVIILFTIYLSYKKYKRNELNVNDFYNKVILKLLSLVVVVIISLFLTTNNDSINDENKVVVDIEKIRSEILLVKESLLIDDYNKIKSEINAIDDLNIKNALISELSNLEKYVNLNTTVDELIAQYDAGKYIEAYREIEKIDNSEIKDKLYEKIMSLQKGKPLDVKTKFTVQSMNGISYYESIPLHPLENMPLLVVMQANECHIDLAKNTSKYTNQEFFMIAPDIEPYNEDSLKKLKDVIENLIEKYKINRGKIVVTGHSYGGLSTLKLVNFFPNYFSAAVPISSTIPEFRASSYAKTAFWGICASEESCATTMKEYASRIGGNAKYSVVPGGHSDSACAFVNRNVLEWAFAQENK